ncbi:aminotransferase class III-fold pyridoxal phosphate-dependent enzyme [Vineibacter terrae]|uniref:Aminotransferase class III-fold pyridoxal phosphate-dependent enzyme n=1 Tax=Vineibacter terrae TaxID=2586908 RepID=A0A5C8PB11_9HYPH|nr:aminotransferase class III-fold pyridoxal phosphate-dependent enzyme [Vineibacter terrae]TXL70442.1 aminotransferase class III-fold pyridoxal phosphate-dependent enzyme [Vineibacter terrae]
MSALLKQRIGSGLTVAAKAAGVRIFDSQGRDYIDGSGGAMTVSIGHGVSTVLAAIQRQAEAVCFTYRTQFTTEPAEQLASELTALAPEGINAAFFVNSGSEATELAMRAAIQYWREVGQPGKTRILGRQISYHGMTMGALSMSGHPARRKDYGDLLHPFAVGPVADNWGRTAGERPNELESSDAWDKAIAQAGADTVAALIVEPVIGAAGGALVPPIGHLRMLRNVFDRNGILLITDEVITGIGRTGTWFASEHDGVVPDLIAVGKGMTSGYTPMGAVLFHDRIVEAMRQGSGMAPFGHTFSGNPLSAAASLAVLRYIRDNDVLANVKARAAQLQAGLHDLQRRYTALQWVRGRGLLWGFDLRKPDPAATASTGALFAADCFAEGLIVYPAGIAPRDHAAIVSPPLTITANDMNDLLRRLEAGLRRFTARAIPSDTRMPPTAATSH